MPLSFTNLATSFISSGVLTKGTSMWILVYPISFITYAKAFRSMARNAFWYAPKYFPAPLSPSIGFSSTGS